MTSKWTRQRREKRKYESYLCDESVAGTSCTNRPNESKTLRANTFSADDSFEGKEVLNSSCNRFNVSSDSGDADSIHPLDEISSDSGDADSIHPLDKMSHDSSVRPTQGLLRDWAIKHQITHTALRDLLEILKNRYDSELPVDPRTLCKTPSHLSSQIKHLGGGEYFHFGLKNALNEFLNSLSGLEVSKVKSIFLKVNCDGLPLFKSSGKQFWPLLVQFCTDNEAVTASKPFPVSLFLGNSKPNNVAEYVKDFIEEMLLLKDGYEYRGMKYSVSIQCFICDAPARQYLKCIASHTGYSGCERCIQHGEHIDGAVTFPDLHAQPRTDENFLSRVDCDHHKATSPLVDLGIGFISQFVLDPMHLLYLGVMRKLIRLWLKGPLPTRIGTRCKDEISANLIELADFMPMEFSRKPRSLNDLDRYKATEFRTFLLYTGPVCLKRIVDENIFKNFLLLSVSITLLSEHCDSQNLEMAQKYLIAFIKHFELLYGRRHLVYNVHNLIHLTDDVRRHETLDKFSAFTFENYLGSMKKLLRKPNAILSQVVNRIFEMKSSKSEKETVKYPIIRQMHKDGPILDNKICTQFKALYFQTFCIRLTPADQGIMVNGKVGRVVNIIQYEGDSDISVLYHVYKMYEDLYDYPVKSGTLGIYIVSDKSGVLKTCSYKAIQRKYILFPYGMKTAAFPLIHTNHQQ